MTEVPYFRALSDLARFINYCCFVFVIMHRGKDRNYFTETQRRGDAETQRRQRCYRRDAEETEVLAQRRRGGRGVSAEEAEL
jgi:hypothetical protein